MADAADPSGGGEAAFAYLQTIGIPDLVRHLIQLTELARRRGMMDLADQVGLILDGLLADVNAAAVQMAGASEGMIIKAMFETHSAHRPISGAMETHIRSEPGPLGSVRVALISELDKIVNPRGYGPFWRAQEYGTGTDEVPTQIGRPLFGTFEPSGDPPDGQQQGQGVGRDLAFVPRGRNPGFGRISVDLPGRHFLLDGSTAAGERYLQRMNEVQEKWLARLRELMGEVRAQSTRLFTGRIEA